MLEEILLGIIGALLVFILRQYLEHRAFKATVADSISSLLVGLSQKYMGETGYAALGELAAACGADFKFGE